MYVMGKITGMREWIDLVYMNIAQNGKPISSGQDSAETDNNSTNAIADGDAYEEDEDEDEG